ncbi:hypothetical protein [Archangium sp. Cb G35]|uniref:hypothetical protein n=1 Tax=Archangium sp. Cb G35 TaxID=1920190 RepID=UPI001E64F40E|nr:hypothetical protein [Archangium sp. Cb G35]
MTFDNIPDSVMRRIEIFVTGTAIATGGDATCGIRFLSNGVPDTREAYGQVVFSPAAYNTTTWPPGMFVPFVGSDHYWRSTVIAGKTTIKAQISKHGGVGSCELTMSPVSRLYVTIKDGYN